MKLMQLKDDAIDVADWRRDEEFAAYPEGARDKTLLYSPSLLSSSFLKNDHRYLFKRSSPRYAEQFWMEIFAYRLGNEMDVPVPPAFVAYDSEKNQSGALIEWFLRRVDAHNDERYIPGGDYCQQYIANFDRKKGQQHNFATVSQIFNDLSEAHPHFQIQWQDYWAKALTFDALIGNTDRHQDNWGIIVNPTNNEIRIAPIFDNGTSLGHEILSHKFAFHEERSRLEKYVAKGWHHMKWHDDSSPACHLGLLKKFANQYPATQQVMLDCLVRVNDEIFKDILDNLVLFEVPVKLTTERANFMLKLLQYRHQRLISELERNRSSHCVEKEYSVFV